MSLTMSKINALLYEYFLNHECLKNNLSIFVHIIG